MTAAVARPPLFSHLLASKPARERSLGATATSITLHAALVLGALLLSARVRPITVEVDPPVPLVPTPMIDAPRDNAPPAKGPTRFGPPAPAPVPVPMPPDIVPSIIPAPSRHAVEPFPGLRGVAPVSVPGTRDGTPQPGGDDAIPEFVAYTVKPELLNRIDISRLLQRYYPTLLLQAGIGGQVVVWLQVDESGRVVDTRISRPSKHPELDRAALRVAEAARFSPAYNRDQKVKVWVELPIVFGTR